jgi:hypothetical protein
MYEKCLEGTYRIAPAKSWELNWSKNRLSKGLSVGLLLDVLYITLLKIIAPRAGEWLLFDLAVIIPVSIQKITNLTLNISFTNIDYHK